MKKVLVTGGAGFIGSHTVVELHNAGFDPVIIDNFSNSNEKVLGRIEAITGKAFKHYNIDCTDKKALQNVFQTEGEIFSVIHFAAYKSVNESVANPSKYYHNNIGATMTLLEVMNEFNVSNLVFSSSCTVYGQPKKLPVNEESPLQEASSPYGFTKQVCEQMIQYHMNAFPENQSAVLLRYFNPIGAHESGLIGELPLGVPANLVPYLTQTAAGIREKLTVFGDDYSTPDGTCIRDYIHVVDLAQAHIKAMEWLSQQTENCHIFNLGSGKGDSVMEIIQTFESVTGVKVPYSIGERRPGDVEQIYAAADKASNQLKWSTKKTLADALKDAWNWQMKLEEIKL